MIHAVSNSGSYMPLTTPRSPSTDILVRDLSDLSPYEATFDAESVLSSVSNSVSHIDIMPNRCINDLRVPRSWSEEDGNTAGSASRSGISNAYNDACFGAPWKPLPLAIVPQEGPAAAALERSAERLNASYGHFDLATPALQHRGMPHSSYVTKSSAAACSAALGSASKQPVELAKILFPSSTPHRNYFVSSACSAAVDSASNQPVEPARMLFPSCTPHRNASASSACSAALDSASKQPVELAKILFPSSTPQPVPISLMSALALAQDVK